MGLSLSKMWGECMDGMEWAIPRRISQIIDAEKFECPSTEALQAKIEDLNRRLAKDALEEGYAEKGKVVAGSLDFKAWYPSLKKEVVVPTLRKRLEKSPADVKVNEVELARFLFVMMEEEDIIAEELSEVLHTMKNDGQEAEVDRPRNGWW